MDKRGQITIFIIVAIFLVLAFASYLIFKDSFKKNYVPSSLVPVETKFVYCLEEYSRTGISMLGFYGGNIGKQNYEVSSRYSPFSSHLDFLGRDIPYWFYLNPVGIQKENIPSLEKMEVDLESYLDSKIKNCVLNELYDQGYEIEFGTPKSFVKISEDYLDVETKIDLSVKKGEDSFVFSKFETRVPSKIGELYSISKEVYDLQKNSMFLENYTIDVLRLNAPVDGLEISCSPLSWDAREVYSEVRTATVENIISLKNEGASSDYFKIKGLPQEGEIRFVSMENWPNYFEVNPSQGEKLIAEPVGNKEGFGILGFCYVPYHYVYNYRYPVLIQVFKDGELFQFPVVVLIEGNQPRKPLEGESWFSQNLEICENSNTQTKISVYDRDLSPVEAKMSYDCLGEVCSLGLTQIGELEALLPQCINGNLIAEAEGYKTTSVLYSSVEEGSAIIIMDKSFEKEVQIFVGGNIYSGKALITFDSGSFSDSAYLPEDKSIKLSEGNYNLQVNLFEEGNIQFPGGTREQCLEVSRNGLLGIFGASREECFEIEIPSQNLSNVLIGGGNTEIYFSEFLLDSFDKLILSVDKVNNPFSFKDLQENYLILETNKIEVKFE